MASVLARAATRAISGIVAFMMAVTPFAGVKSGKNAVIAPTEGVKEITVSADSNFKTIESARDFIRTLDKSKYEGIKVTVASGYYTVDSALTFTKEDSGTETCPISYVGEDGATVVGGVRLTAEDFSKETGALSEYFPAESKDQIVTVDLKDYGFTAEMIADAMKRDSYLQTVPFLSADGERQMLAQYPNDWMHIGEVVTHSADGTTNTARDGIDLQTVNYGEEHAAFVQSWSEAVPVYIRGRFFKLWCPDDSRVVSISQEDSTVDILFGGGHEPAVGTIMYFYNVPEALDIPGEYIIDTDAILYYYPTDTFETATLTVPLSADIMVIENADYLTFENIDFTSSTHDGIVATGNHLTFDGCEVSAVCSVGVRLTGNDIVFENGAVFDCGSHGICGEAGDIETLEGGNILLYNNDIHHVSMTNAYGYGVDFGGVNVTVSHNDVHDSGFKAIHFAGAVNCVAEYNDVYRMLLLCDDVGALSIDSRNNANIVFRYNYVHEIGPEGEAAKIRDYNPDYEYYGADAIYHDGGASYCEMYGNIINGCDDGYRSNGGRNNSFHNNIVMDCRMWYCLFVEVAAIENFVDNGVDSSIELPSYVTSKAWKEVNPDYKTLKFTTEGADKFDPTLWCAPANLEAYDNYIFYNKADRYFTRWGIRPYSFEKYILDFNPDSIEAAETHMTTYSSTRTSLTVEDAIVEAESVTGITLEIFRSIGRIEK